MENFEMAEQENDEPLNEVEDPVESDELDSDDTPVDAESDEEIADDEEVVDETVK